MRLLMLGILCCVFWTAQAQEGNYKKLVRKQTKELSRLYQLDKAQATAVLAIQERHYQQLAEIESLKTSGKDRAYLHKLKSIRKGLQFELQKVLRPDQMPIFAAECQRQERAYQDKLAALKASGATKEKLEMAKITIE